MSRRNNQRAAGQPVRQQAPGNAQQPRQVDMRRNPLYPDRIESNALGVLIAFVAIIVAIVALALIVKNFSYPAREQRAYIARMNAEQEQADFTESQIAEDTDVYDGYEDMDVYGDETGDDWGSGSDDSDLLLNGEDEFADADQGEDDDASREGIHSYTVTVSDCTWEDAWYACESQGGHLATIDSREEWDYLINLLKQQNTGAYYFYLGGARDMNDVSYYWLDRERMPYGNPINSNLFWGSDLWLEGEPSFQDGDTPETSLAILYMKSSDRWVLNDVANDTLYTEQYLAGKVAYICEFE